MTVQHHCNGKQPQTNILAAAAVCPRNTSSDNTSKSKSNKKLLWHLYCP